MLIIEKLFIESETILIFSVSRNGNTRDFLKIPSSILVMISFPNGSAWCKQWELQVFPPRYINDEDEILRPITTMGKRTVARTSVWNFKNKIGLIIDW